MTESIGLHVGKIFRAKSSNIPGYFLKLCYLEREFPDWLEGQVVYFKELVLPRVPHDRHRSILNAIHRDRTAIPGLENLPNKHRRFAISNDL